MESMTGFGAGQAESSAGVVEVQISSVNNKGCRVSVRSDVRDLGLEERVRSRVQAVLKRGSISVQIAWRSGSQLSFDADAVRITWMQLSALAEELGAPKPSLVDAARLTVRSESDPSDHVATLVDAALEAALDACLAMRRTEGQALKQAFEAHHAKLAEVAARIAEQSAGRPAVHAERLLLRMQELLRDRAEITPEHLIRELAIYSDRIDVTEEMVRLESHLAQLATLIASAEPSGKKLEFLLQELGREVNTTGSKANDAELQQLVVAAKEVIEQMKEQAANVL